MKKLITTFICLMLSIGTLSFTVFASEYEVLIDNADFIASEDETYLQERIDYVKVEHDYNITLVSGEFETEEAFDDYAVNFSEYDSNEDGTILIIGGFGEMYNYYSIPYGEYSDVLNDAILTDFEEFDASSESYEESYEMYITLVQIFLEEQAANTEIETETTTQETNEVEENKPSESTVEESASEESASEEVVDTAGMIGEFDPMIDAAELFSEDEEAELFGRIKEIHDTYDFDVTILTMNEVPDDSYDLREYFDWYEGVDPTRDGVVVGVNMDEANREFSLTARNFGTEAFTEDAQSVVHEEVPPLLTEGEYFKAFNLFLDQTEEFLETAKAGEPYEKPVDILTVLIFVVALPLILALLIAWLIVRFVFVAQMKTAVIKTEAKEFMVKDSLILEENSDVFTHESESRVYDPPSENKGGGSSSSSGYGGGRSGSSSSF